MESELDDEALAAAAARGDAQAFHALFDRHYDRVYRTALAVLRNTAEAEDAAQEVWCALPAKLKQWRGEGRFTTWLHRIAVNAGRDALRRLASRSRLADGFAEADGLARGEAADQARRLDWLDGALAVLSDDLRETAALVLAEEMTQGEAAMALGVAEGTVAWRMSEVRKRLTALAETEREAFG